MIINYKNTGCINPITHMDYPDPDVIRVGSIYYMVSTTMHFMPGCEILRSEDLINWSHEAYVFDVLEGTDGQRLLNGKNIYGQGMWAPSLRYHNGDFYICFSANDTHKTYLYISASIKGPWRKQTIEGFYHDPSLLFDGDRVYISYGNKNVYITELNSSLTAPKEGGLSRLAVSDGDNPILGYEGSHLYKIDGSYYLFLIHSRADRWRRVQACFVADSIDGCFKGGDVFDEDGGYLGSGIAQGGIVDTPEGKWYAILFQDRGASGRMPVLIPVRFEEGYPVFGNGGSLSECLVAFDRPDVKQHLPVESDDFKGSGDSFGLNAQWQFNHEPELSLFEHDSENGRLIFSTDRIDNELLSARNTLTVRMIEPACSGEIALDVSGIREGDEAGLCMLQGSYAYIAVSKREGKNYLVMKQIDDTGECAERECLILCRDKVILRADADFTAGCDKVKFSYYEAGEFVSFGSEHHMVFGLDHFVGARFGLFYYSAKEPGGKAVFSQPVY